MNLKASKRRRVAHCISSPSSCFPGRNNRSDAIRSSVVKTWYFWMNSLKKKEQPQDNKLPQNMTQDIYCVAEVWMWFRPHLERCWRPRKDWVLSSWMAACPPVENQPRWSSLLWASLDERLSAARMPAEEEWCDKHTSRSTRLGLPLKD